MTISKSKEIALAIERVADKRHAALCLNRPEAEAAACVVCYIESMQAKYKDWPVVISHIKHVKAGYLASVGNVDHLTTQCFDQQAIMLDTSS